MRCRLTDPQYHDQGTNAMSSPRSSSQAKLAKLLPIKWAYLFLWLNWQAQTMMRCYQAEFTPSSDRSFKQEHTIPCLCYEPEAAQSPQLRLPRPLIELSFASTCSFKRCYFIPWGWSGFPTGQHSLLVLPHLAPVSLSTKALTNFTMASWEADPVRAAGLTTELYSDWLSMCSLKRGQNCWLNSSAFLGP